MARFFYSLLALMKKEFLAIWSDKKSRVIIIVPPLLQLLVFSYAVNLEVKNIAIGVLDRDNSTQSRELIRSLGYSSTFVAVEQLGSEAELTSRINTQKVLATVYIPQDFARKLASGEKVSLQIIADGRKSSTAQIAQSYIQTAIQKSFGDVPLLTQSLVARSLYNPNLDNFWWIMPSLMGPLSMIIAILLTALSVARERELGTFEQILVAPLSVSTIIIGKTIPPLLISLADATAIFAIMHFIFDVPFLGSLLVLYTGLIAFLFSIVGIGLFISSVVSTQQQGILGAFVLMVPYILMSGFATPVENMPEWLIPVTDFVSLKYFLLIIKGSFLKSIGWDVALELILPMLWLGIGSLLVASWMFRKKIA